MNLRKAAEMALEALEFESNDAVPENLIILKTFAINELRQALAQPEQEPVAWITDGGKGELGWRKTTEKDISLYTAPPKREWVGLTDEEMEGLWDRYAHMEMMRAIEAKLKEKNT